MNHLQKHFSASLIALVALCSASSMAMAAPASSLSNFAILSASPAPVPGAVTLTRSVINGDVGSSGPAASVVQTDSTINGSIIAPVSASVVTAFNTALSNGLALSCDHTLTQDAYTDQILQLASGVTCSNTAAVTFTRTTLVLNGSGPWTIIVSSAPAADGSRTGALTGTGLNVVLADGITPAPCDAVTWYVAQAATFTGSNSVGTVYTGAAISSTGTTVTAGTPPTTILNGNLLAGAAVTVIDTTVNGCTTTKGHHYGQRKAKCNQGVGNGTESCDPGNSNNMHTSNDEVVNGEAGTPGDPGRQPDNSTSPF